MTQCRKVVFFYSCFRFVFQEKNESSRDFLWIHTLRNMQRWRWVESHCTWSQRMKKGECTWNIFLFTGRSFFVLQELVCHHPVWWTVDFSKYSVSIRFDDDFCRLCIVGRKSERHPTLWTTGINLSFFVSAYWSSLLH